MDVRRRGSQQWEPLSFAQRLGLYLQLIRIRNVENGVCQWIIYAGTVGSCTLFFFFLHPRVG